MKGIENSKVVSNSFGLCNSAEQRIDDYIELARKSAEIKSSFFGKNDEVYVVLPSERKVKFFR